MSYIENMEVLFAKPYCSVIFAEDSTMAEELFNELAAEHPEYISEPGAQFGETKGIFHSKNTRRFYNLIYSTEKIKKVRKKYKSGLTVDHAIRRQISRMKLRLVDVEHRTIDELSPLERLRASILYDILNGKTKFIISDSSDESKESCFIISQYMKKYEDYDGDETIQYQLVWITASTPGEMLNMMGEDEFQSDHYSFYTVQDGSAAELDKEALTGNGQTVKETMKSAAAEKSAVKTQTEEPKTGNQTTCSDRKSCSESCSESCRETSAEKMKRQRHAQKAFEEGRVYDMFSGINLYNPINDKPEKAYPLYKIAAEEGHPGAQYALGRLYSMHLGVCEFDEEKALYWFAMAVFNEEYDEASADPILRQCHQMAQNALKDLVVRLENGKVLLHRSIGDRAEAFVKDAQEEADREREEKALDDALSKLIDREKMFRGLDEYMKKEGIK